MISKTMRILPICVLCTSISLSYAGEIENLQDSYINKGASAFDKNRGQQLWERAGIKERTCASCHGQDLTTAGKHAKTQKVITAMAPSNNPRRYQQSKKIEKWFKRNCKWTWGWECSLQEKGDMLEYLKSL